VSGKDSADEQAILTIHGNKNGGAVADTVKQQCQLIFCIQ